MTKTLPASFCANCGAEVTNAGRAQPDGRRYCRAKPCLAAKARQYRASRARFKIQREAPTACAGCGRALPVRDWRAGDELGRWCQRSRCRAERDRLRDQASLAELPALTKRIALLEETIMFLSEVVMADSEDYMLAGRTICRACGLTTAITGWVHPTATGGGCRGTLGSASPRPFDIALGMAGAWPFTKEWLTPAELEERFAD